MRIGVLTQYKIGYDAYGIKILNIFPEHIIRNYSKNINEYHETTYYIKFENQLWFVENYQLNTLIDKQKLKCKLAIQIAKSIIIKLMLDKKYEG